MLWKIQALEGVRVMERVAGFLSSILWDRVASDGKNSMGGRSEMADGESRWRLKSERSTGVRHLGGDRCKQGSFFRHEYTRAASHG